MVRVWAVNLDTGNKSDAIHALGIASDEVHMSDELIPKMDISYFVTENIGAELVLARPEKHSVSIASTDVKLTGGDKVTSIDIDPLMFGIGVGYRF